ncbi:MAG: methyltransferase domain-containing protein [Gemmatimonadetes bacterium]|nr:methyltransferase domain-containing protein [Gemmatimonadota bacterium]NIO32024.1 methyltransferase domain-containing protein [Gemmatimonadota bacterium]
MGSRSTAGSSLVGAIARHYDSLALLYRTFWGEHIHHGLWLADDESPHIAQEHLIEHLAERAGIGRGERVLDVGCGYGASARWLSSRFGCRVTGVTISTAQARLARRRNLRQGHASSIHIVRADAAAPPIHDGTFDLVWVVECIEHLRDKRRFVEETARVLRPGGRFALCTWLRGDGTPADDRLVEDVCESFLCPSLASADEYRLWCEEAGLGVLCSEDLTSQVRKTWAVLSDRVSRPLLAPLKRMLLDPAARRFLDGFATIAEAYDGGAMSYGLLVAGKL